MDFWEAVENNVRLALYATVMASFLTLMVVCVVASSGRRNTKFSMELASFEGLNATIAGDTTVSAAFTLKMRVESPGVLLLWCSNGAEVVVSYAGIALAWGDLPGFCVERSGEMELTVKPWGRGVGLSEELRRRLDTEWRAGTAQMLVHVKLFYSRSLSPADDIYGTSSHLYHLKLTDAPKFSVEFRGATGLDAAPAHDDVAPISTAFNFTLHAANRRQVDRCYRHGEAVVRYSGYTVASARTRAFCVGTKEARDVPVVAWAEGVGLPWSIRERMAADWQAGAVDLEVDVKLLRGDDGSARPTWMSCKVKAGGGSGAKPSRTTRCTAFGFQNWASDITPAWMQYF
ncbi:hypothetical protein EJB05_17233, partial [Eragrostis curvula]